MDSREEMMKAFQYIVSDTRDDDLPVLVGTARDIAAYLGTTINSVTSSISHRETSLLRHRYKITKIKEEE